MKIRFPIITVALCLALTTAMAAAEDSVHKQHQFDAASLDSVRLTFKVGTLHIEHSTSGDIEVELVIRTDNNRSWFRRTPDIASMDLQHRTVSGELRLEFDENNVRTDWIVRLPDLAYLTVDLGVGTVEGDLPAGAADIELGVGSVNLFANRQTTGLVDLRASVGDTILTGEASNEQRQGLISSKSSGTGRGDQRVTVRVGVGDIVVRLN